MSHLPVSSLLSVGAGARDKEKKSFQLHSIPLFSVIIHLHPIINYGKERERKWCPSFQPFYQLSLYIYFLLILFPRNQGLAAVPKASSRVSEINDGPLPSRSAINENSIRGKGRFGGEEEVTSQLLGFNVRSGLAISFPVIPSLCSLPHSQGKVLISSKIPLFLACRRGRGTTGRNLETWLTHRPCLTFL